MTHEAQEHIRKNLARLLAATAPAWGLDGAKPAAAAAQRPAPAARGPAPEPARTRELHSFDPGI